jgi:hypothetical protein
MTETNATRAAGSSAPACSASCSTCENWEGRLIDPCKGPELGYCPIFDKLTRHNHGKRCTAYAPNASGEEREV